MRLELRPEWSESWKSWPHCNTQGGCWMHVSESWCGCLCQWCWLAKKVRRLDCSGKDVSKHGCGVEADIFGGYMCKCGEGSWTKHGCTEGKEEE